jgi:Oxygenase domain of the 2OGFeDO superfamily
MSVRTIVAKEKLDCEHLLGQFLDESHFDEIIDEDCNFFAPANCGLEERANCETTDCASCPKGIDEENVIFILRKNFFTEEEQLGALEGLRGAASASQNRGIAAGPRGEKLQNREWVTDMQLDILDYFSNPKRNLFDIDVIQEIYDSYSSGNIKSDDSTRGFVWLTSKTHANNFDFDQWVLETKKLPEQEQIKEAERIRDWISNTNYAMPVFSGVAGYFDRYPRIPYGRASSYTANNKEKFKLSYPLLQKLAKAFSQILPKRYAFQKSCADKIDQEFVIPETPFTTLTVNKSFRTAAHRDAGDLHKGFSNLTVLTNGKKYSGGMLVLPEFRVAVNIQPSDLLLINNHGGIHGNTPIVLEEEGAERYSLVCYFREKMLELGTKEYEDYRFNFIESRRLNKEHPLWRPLWNGISPGWESSEEWKDYLLGKPNGEIYLKKHHKKIYENTFSKKNTMIEELY